MFLFFLLTLVLFFLSLFLFSFLSLLAGSKFTITLKELGPNTTTSNADAPTLQEDGTYYTTITPPKVGNYTLRITMDSVDTTNTALVTKTNIGGSPFALEATEPICPPNSQVDVSASAIATTPGNVDPKDPAAFAGACVCKPGHTLDTTAGAVSSFLFYSV